MNTKKSNDEYFKDILKVDKMPIMKYSRFFYTESKIPGQRAKLFSRLGKNRCENGEKAITKAMYDYSDMIYLTRSMIELQKEIFIGSDIYSYRCLNVLRFMLIRLKIDMIRTQLSDSEIEDELGHFYYIVFNKKYTELITKVIKKIDKRVNKLFDSVLTVIMLSPVFENSKIIGFSGFTTVHKKEEQDLIEERYNFLPLSSINNLCRY